MGRLRSVAGVPAGRWSKWAVVAFWLVVVALAGPLAGKLTSAEQNEARNWLPASAESTQVLEMQSRVQSPNVIPAVVVYDRPSGITAADRAQAAADVKEFAAVPGVTMRRSPGRSPPATGRRSRRSSRSTWAGTAGTRRPRPRMPCARSRTTAAMGCPLTSPARWARPPTPRTRSPVSTAPCCSPRWPW